MQSKSQNNPKLIPKDLQGQDDPKLSFEQLSELEEKPKKEDSTKNQIHPEVLPPQNILKETPQGAQNLNKEMTNGKSFSHEINGKLKDKRIIENKKEKPNNMEFQDLEMYQNGLLPEGVGSVEKLLGIYTNERKKKKLGKIKEFNEAHEGKIMAVAVTPDGKHIISAGEDKSIKIFDIETEQEIFLFKNAHHDIVKSICVSADGKFLYSGSSDRCIKIFDLVNKQQIHHFLKIHDDRVLSIKVSNNGQFLCSASADKSVKITDLKTYQTLHHFEKVHDGLINSIALTSDDKYLVTGSDEQSIAIFDLETKQEVHRFEEAHNHKINCVTTSPDGRFIISGSEDASIKIFDLKTRQEIHHFEGVHKSAIRSIAVSPNGKYIISGSQDRSVQIFDFETKRTIHQYHYIEDGGILSVAVTPDSRHIVTSSQFSNIIVLSLEVSQQVHTLSGVHQGSVVNCVETTPDNKFAISGGNDESIKIFDIKTGNKIHEFQEAHEGGVAAITVTSDSQFLISAGGESIKVFNLQEKKEIHHFRDLQTSGIQSIAVSPDDKFIVWGCLDKSIKGLDFKSEEKNIFNFQTKEQDQPVCSVKITPDGKQLVAAFQNAAINIFDMKTKHLVFELEKTHDRKISCMTLTNDGRYMIVGLADGFVKVFDFQTKQEIHTFNGGSLALSNKIFSVNTWGNRFIMAGYESGEILIFDLEKRELIHFQSAHGSAVTSIAATSDGSYLVSCSKDKSVKIFNLQVVKQELGTFFHEDYVMALAVTKDGENIIFAGGDRSIKIIDRNTQEQIHCIENAHEDRINMIAVSPDNQYLVSGSEDKTIKLFDLKSRKEISRFESLCNDSVRVVLFTSDSKFIIYASDLGPMTMINIQTGVSVPLYLELSSSGIRCLALTSDGRFLAVGYRTDLYLLDLQTREKVYHFENTEDDFGQVESVAITPNNKYMVIGSHGKMVKIFDFQTKQLVHQWKTEHTGQIWAVAVTPDSRYVVSGCEDQSVRVFDIETRQLVQNFDKIHTDPVSHLAITSDGKYLISATLNTIKTIELNLDNSQGARGEQGYLEQETFVFCDGIRNHTFFNSIDDFLFSKKMPLETLISCALKYQELTIQPYSWNVLHVIALQANHAFFRELPEFNEFKVPFMLDHFGKTPLHYLMANKKIDYTSINSMFAYICDYLDDCYSKDICEFQEILKSLTLLISFILNKIESRLKERFLNICFAVSPVPYNKELPPFGQVSSQSCFYEMPVFDEKSKASIWKDGETQVNFYTNFLHLDYNINSQDMQVMVDLMAKQKNEDFFKTPLISKLINHLWNQTQKVLLISFLSFSIFMGALSVYLCLNNRNLTFEIVLLALSGIFVANEALQVHDLGVSYLKNYWNWIDVSHLMLTIAFLITRLKDSENELARAWLSTMVIALGYLRWVSYLRIFQATRNLIQVIITIAKDMLSFIVIIVVIIFGFSIIFLVFERESEYGIYLYNTYSILYGPLDIENDVPFSVSKKVIMVVIAFLLNVLLLNLLISIMGDSYDKILEKRDKTDALTKLQMMSEAVTYMKVFKRNYKTKRGYLLYCLALDVEEDENVQDEWEGRINIMKKLLKQTSEQTKSLKDTTEKRISDLEKEMRQQNKENRERLDRFESNIQNMIQRLMVERDEVLVGKMEGINNRKIITK